MKSKEKELFTIYLLIDLFILNSCFVVLNWFRQDAYVSNFYHILIYFIHFNLCWIIAYFAFSKKNLYLRDGFSNRIRRITKRFLIYIAFTSITAFLFLPKFYSRHYFAEHILVFYLGSIAAYYVVYLFLKYRRKKGLNTNRAVIIGNCETAYLLREVIDNNPILGYKFLGFVLHNYTHNRQNVLGLTHNLDALIKEHRIEMIFSIQSTSNYEFNESLITICDKYGIRLRIVPENNSLYKMQHNSETISGIALINPREAPLDHAGVRISKRFFDIFFSLFIIIFVFTWLFPILALLIKLTSKGPVFFSQKRTGINNRTFTCYKFRSMQQNILSDFKQATLRDERITSIGKFMRETWIDELPQFFNVFLGQMSVVGPRPHMLKHTKEYSALIRNYLVRHHVKPGITGWAQVNGFCGETDELWKMERRVELDKFYIKNWTFFFDLKIIWATIFRIRGKESVDIKSIYLRPVIDEPLKTNNVQKVSNSVMSENEV